MRAGIVLFTGVLMLLSAGAHAGLGWPPLRAILVDSGVDAATTGAIGAGWLWGSVSMTVFGVVTVMAGLRLRRGDRSLVRAVAAIAGGYLAFGIVALLIRRSPHFLLFVTTGLLAGLPLLPGPRARSRSGGTGPPNAGGGAPSG